MGFQDFGSLLLNLTTQIYGCNFIYSEGAILWVESFRVGSCAHPLFTGKEDVEMSVFLLEIETQHYFVELPLTSGKAFPVITKLCFGMEKIKATTAEADMRASSP